MKLNVDPFWPARSQARVTDASSVAELRLCLGELELAIKPDHLSPEFRMKPHLIKVFSRTDADPQLPVLPSPCVSRWLLPKATCI